MKKVILFVAAAIACVFVTSGCGAVLAVHEGSTTLSVKSRKSEKVTVYVDGQRHDVKTVPEKKADTAKQTTKNTIEIPAGSHEVTVKKDDQQLHQETVKASGETRNVVEIKEEAKGDEAKSTSKRDTKTPQSESNKEGK